MALKTFRPDPGPSPGTGFKPTIKVHEAEFGDGYSQPTPAGLNHIREELTLKWDALTEDQMHRLNAFFREHKGVIPFYYKPVGDKKPRKWTCKEWDRAMPDGLWTFSATLKEDFSGVV